MHVTAVCIQIYKTQSEDKRDSNGIMHEIKKLTTQDLAWSQFYTTLQDHCMCDRNPKKQVDNFKKTYSTICNSLATISNTEFNQSCSIFENRRPTNITHLIIPS